MLNSALPQSQPTPAVPIGMKQAQENMAGKMGAGAGAPALQPSTPKTPPSSDLPKLKKKFPLKYILGGLFLLILLIGAGVGFYLSKQEQDVRQQASGTNCCEIPVADGGWDCGNDDAQWTAGYYAGISGACGTQPSGQEEPALPTTCEATSFTNNMTCMTVSTDRTSACTNYVVGRFTRPMTGPDDSCFTSINRRDSGISFGTPICATPNLCECMQVDLIKSDGTWTSAVKAGNWDASCEDSPSSPPPTTYSCNSDCTTNAECQTADASFVCDTATSNKCRLESNLTSETCLPEEIVYACNSDCTTNAECQTADASFVCDTATSNKCRLESNLTSETCRPGGGITYACNSDCTTNAECQTADASFVCDATAGNKCRLDTYPTSETCEEPEPSPTPTVGCNEPCTTDNDCADESQFCNNETDSCRLTENPGDENCAPAVTPTPTPTPTPAPGCNEPCTANSDCTNANSVCYNSLCRLDSNPTSTTCAPAGNYYEQPDLPATLPESGSQEIMNWLKIGLGALALGLAFLFI